MPIIEHIDSAVGDNVGGGLFIDIIDRNLVPDFSIVDHQVTTNIQSNLANWSRIHFAPNSLRYRERNREVRGVSIPEGVISGTLAKDRLQLMRTMRMLRDNRWVIIFYTRNGDRLVIGTKRTPVLFRRESRDTKREGKQRNAYEVEFYIKSKREAAFYNPIPQSDLSWLDGTPRSWMNGAAVKLMGS